MGGNKTTSRVERRKRALIKREEAEAQLTPEGKKLMAGLRDGLSIEEAGAQAGLEGRKLKTTLNSKVFLMALREENARIPLVRKELAKMRLKRIYDIEEKVLEACQKDTNEVAKHAKVLEREYRLADLLSEEGRGQQAQTIVNINAAQLLMGSLYHPDRVEAVVQKEDPEPVQDAVFRED